MIEPILITITLVVLIIGSISDLKTREVPDWLNYGLLCIALGIRLLYSVLNSDYMFFVNGFIGFILAFSLGLFMYYTGQWGGGDTKMLMGLGALVGYNINLGVYLLNIMMVGAIYGITWTLGLAITNRKAFWRKFKIMIRLRKVKLLRRLTVVFTVIMIGVFFYTTDLFIKIVAVMFALMIYFSLYMWIVVKIIEEVAMLALVEPSELTEGDWIMHDVKYKDKVIASPKDLGVRQEQIEILKKLYKQNKIKKIMIKNGIPFVPSFFLAYLLLLLVGNWITFFI